MEKYNKNMQLEVLLLRNNNCHVWRNVLHDLQEEMEKFDLEPTVKILQIDTGEQAKQYKFFGSPQVLVNGADIDPMAKGMKNFHVTGCRVYFWKGKGYDFPPQEMIRAALRH